MTRCTWPSNPLSIEYHDKEWGVPVHDDNTFFEFLTLEGAQAGLSWDTILRKRENYRDAFHNFDPSKVARITTAKIEKLLTNEGIVRNRLKIISTVSNAKAFLEIQKQHGSFHQYIWQFVDGKPKINHWKTHETIPAKTAESDAISTALIKQGFRFVGSTIIYAFMQATGLVNDHLTTCYRRSEI